MTKGPYAFYALDMTAGTLVVRRGRKSEIERIPLHEIGVIRAVSTGNTRRKAATGLLYGGVVGLGLGVAMGSGIGQEPNAGAMLGIGAICAAVLGGVSAGVGAARGAVSDLDTDYPIGPGGWTLRPYKGP